MNAVGVGESEDTGFGAAQPALQDHRGGLGPAAPDALELVAAGDEAGAQPEGAAVNLLDDQCRFQGRGQSPAVRDPVSGRQL